MDHSLFCTLICVGHGWKSLLKFLLLRF